MEEKDINQITTKRTNKQTPKQEKKQLEGILLSFPFYGLGNRGTERLGDLPKATQLVRGRARICTQVVLTLMHIYNTVRAMTGELG